MLDTSAYYGQTGIPPQLLLQALLGQSHGQHPQGFGGGYMPHGIFGQQTFGQQGQQAFGQQPTWPTFGQGPFGQGPFGGFAQPGLLGQLSGQFGQQGIWPTFGGGQGHGPFGGGFLPPALIAQLGQLAAVAPYLQAAQLGGLMPQLGGWGQQHQLGAFGRGILPYQGVPQMAFPGC